MLLMNIGVIYYLWLEGIRYDINIILKKELVVLYYIKLSVLVGLVQ